MIDRSARSEYAAWVARDRGRDLTDAEACLVDVVCAAFRLGPWDIRWSSLRADGGPVAAYVSVQPDRLATFDFDGLTRLVFAAHDAAARVDVGPAGPSYVRICLYLREREGGVSRRHPTLEAAVAEWRTRHPEAG